MLLIQWRIRSHTCAHTTGNADGKQLKHHPKAIQSHAHVREKTLGVAYAPRVTEALQHNPLDTFRDGRGRGLGLIIFTATASRWFCDSPDIWVRQHHSSLRHPAQRVAAEAAAAAQPINNKTQNATH